MDSVMAEENKNNDRGKSKGVKMPNSYNNNNMNN